MDVIKSIKQERIVAVIRAENQSQATKIVRACVLGGIKIIEITYTIPNAAEVIAAIAKEFGNKITLGAGTVMNKAVAEEATEAGAMFIVAPGFDLETAAFCRKNNVPYIPGCITPTEMMMAKKAGAKIIKLFPGSLVDPSYIKTLKGPFPTIEVMPTGGVNLDNVIEWFKNGACAVGIGSALTKPAKTNDYEQITNVAKSYTSIALEVKSWQK